ncbi:MAG: NADH-quinone oxidoreductase subunit NuoK [Tepidiformaceae bacterium]|nr:NADH-quinone oxidoreductase subunit NuoK [Dehalococcoidia bacterium]
MIPLENYLVLSGILFSLGVYGVLSRRNAVLVLMSVELMLNAVSINFIAFSAYLDVTQITGVIFAIFVVAVAAAEIGLALAIVLRIFRNRSSINIDEAAELKW